MSGDRCYGCHVTVTARNFGGVAEFIFGSFALCRKCVEVKP